MYFFHGILLTLQSVIWPLDQLSEFDTNPAVQTSGFIMEMAIWLKVALFQNTPTRSFGAFFPVRLKKVSVFF